MADFEVNGAESFLLLSKALKNAGRTEMRKELHKGVRKAARPLIPKARKAAREKLPKRGGLADQVAREPARTQVRTGADPGVRVVIGKKRGGARATNRGLIRHRVFGQDVWVEQRIEPGWFDNAMVGEKAAIQRDIEQAMTEVVDQIARGVGR